MSVYTLTLITGIISIESRTIVSVLLYNITHNMFNNINGSMIVATYPLGALV